jgi:hypothetical protein
MVNRSFDHPGVPNAFTVPSGPWIPDLQNISFTSHSHNPRWHPTKHFMGKLKRDFLLPKHVVLQNQRITNSKDTINRLSQPQRLSVSLWQLPAAKSREPDTSLVTGRLKSWQQGWSSDGLAWMKSSRTTDNLYGLSTHAIVNNARLACALSISQILNLRPLYSRMFQNVNLPLSHKKGGTSTWGGTIAYQKDSAPPLEYARRPLHIISTFAVSAHTELPKKGPESLIRLSTTHQVEHATPPIRSSEEGAID